MKTKSLFIAAILVLNVCVTAFGIEKPVTKGMAVIAVRGSEVFKVIYKGQSAGKVKLNVYDKESTLVFSESFASIDGFIRPLNFSALNSGDYFIELVDANGKKTEKISHHQISKSK